MAVNPEYVGRTYPPGPAYLVGREKIREFATAIGDLNPAFHDVDAARALGYPDLVAPPTFPVVMAMKAATAAVQDPGLGLDYTRVVHGEQRFAYSRPVVAGDELIVTVTIEAVRTMAGNDMVTTRGDVTTLAGDHVVSATTLLISRGIEDDS
jgi:acyl dehydratase